MPESIPINCTLNLPTIFLGHEAQPTREVCAFDRNTQVAVTTEDLGVGVAKAVAIACLCDCKARTCMH